MKSKYTIAESCLNKAIALDEKNDIHHHALGMVYRKEIRNRLNLLIRDKATAESSLKEISTLSDQAEKCFENARKLDPETEFGYITHLQLIIDIIERLYRLTNKGNYGDLLADLGPVGQWCRNKLPLAEELLRRVKALQPQNRLSRYTVQCLASIQGFYDNFESMINSLQSLLHRNDIQHPLY
jgi:tetratricopeptide (TPR) repeat protein